MKSQDGSPQHETQEETAPPQPESLSTAEDTSEPPKETTEEESAESKQVPKISFRVRDSDGLENHTYERILNLFVFHRSERPSRVRRQVMMKYRKRAMEEEMRR